MALSIAGSLARTRDANQHLEAAIELNYLRSAKPGTSQACQATDNRADARASPAAEDSAAQRSRSRADTGVNERVLAVAAGFDSPLLHPQTPQERVVQPAIARGDRSASAIRHHQAIENQNHGRVGNLPEVSIVWIVP